jgi:hypothetical protein
MSTPKTSPTGKPDAPIWRRLLFGLIGCFTAIFAQIGRGLWAFVLWCRRRFAERALKQSRRVLCQAMFTAGVGDQLIRERLTTLQKQLNDPKLPAEKRKSTRFEFEAQLLVLGTSGNHSTVPVLAVEREHSRMIRDQQALMEIERNAQSVGARLWPATFFGWFQLLFSYLTAATLAFSFLRR